LGWAEDPDAIATLSYIVVTDDVTLYAIWRSVRLRFWWGNYIPRNPAFDEDGDHWPTWSQFGTFDLQELVDTREESKTFFNSEWGNLDAPDIHEGKHFSDAVRIAAPNFEPKIFNPFYGFKFFIYPTSFGQVNIIDGGSVNINHLFDFHVVDIDGVSYTVAHRNTSVNFQPGGAELRFQWN
jgi:hypothetical protein